MKKNKSALLAKLCATLILSTAIVPVLAFANDDDVPEVLEFEIDNESSHTMTAMFITSNDDPSWEEDILEDDIGPGDVLEITIDDELPGCDYDLKIEYDDGDTEVVLDVDLCEVNDGDVALVITDEDEDAGEEDEDD